MRVLVKGGNMLACEGMGRKGVREGGSEIYTRAYGKMIMWQRSQLHTGII